MANPILTEANEVTSRPHRGSPVSIDHVVTATGALLLVLLASGVAAAALVPTEHLQAVGLGSGLAALVLVWAGRKLFARRALGLCLAVLQGVAVGAISKAYSTYFDGVVTGALLGTVAAFIATLVVYRLSNFRPGAKFHRAVSAAMLGFVVVALIDVALLFFGADLGIHGFGTLGLIFSAVGVVLGVLALVSDFGLVQDALEAGAPEQVKWDLATGLILSLVWIYVDLLRLLAILSSD